MTFKVIEDHASFQNELKNAGAKPVFVDFMAEWCGNCEKIMDNLND